MAVRERQTATLRVAACRNIPPDLRPGPILLVRHSERAIENLIFMHVEEHKNIGRVRIPDLRELRETRIRPAVWIQLRRAVEAQAHVVTAKAQLAQFDPLTRRDRGSVGGTGEVAGATVSGKKRAFEIPAGDKA